MSIQISLNLSDKLFELAKEYAENKGYDSLQELARDALREKLFDKHEPISGIYTAKASEKSLAKNWLTKEEDNAWKHLEKEI